MHSEGSSGDNRGSEMKSAIFLLMFCTSSYAYSQSLQCELMRREILQLHQTLTTDKCELQYRNCLQRSYGDSLASYQCEILKSGCSMQGNLALAFGEQQRLQQALSQQIQQYQGLCRQRRLVLIAELLCPRSRSFSTRQPQRV